jgi:hypothetical protein
MLETSKPYFLFNREERHLAAVLFHLLCHGKNLARLVHSRRPDWAVLPNECGVYFDYSFLRDAWHGLGKGVDANAKKRAVLRSMLERFGATPALLHKIDAEGTGELNGLFISRPSVSHIQSPANWQLAHLASPGVELGRDDVLAACRLKWAFKSKPDLVVQPSLKRALCIELKLESVEGTYPSDGTEKAILKSLGLYGPGGAFALPMRQTDLQRLMMHEIFGADHVSMLFVTRHEPRNDVPGPAVSWSHLLQCLEIPAEAPRFVREAFGAIRGPSRA